MDMNSLMHHRGNTTVAAAPPSSIDSFRAPAPGGVPSYPNSSLPGLRAHLPSLPIRLAALHAPSEQQQRVRQDAPSSASSSSASSSLSSSSQSSSSVLSSSQQATSLAPLRFIIPSSHCPPPAPSSVSSTAAMYTSGISADATTNVVNIRPAGGHPQPSNGTVPRSFSDPSLLSAMQDHHHHHQHQHQQHQRHVLHHQHNRPPPLDIAMLIATTAHDMENAAALSTDGSLTDGKLKKSPGKRNRTVKNPNRSTKSKARPGLRKGKWTEEEERYATQLTNYFKEGLLPIERGTMLRLYLSQKLNCEPMRITKKFTGGECIGKQVFRPCTPTQDTRVRLMQAQLELVALEAAFIKKLKENKEEVPGLTDDVDSSLAPGALAGSARPKKRRPYRKERKAADGSTVVVEDKSARDDGGFTSDSSTSSDTTTLLNAAEQRKRHAENGHGQGNVDDVNAVGLLLDFFYKAASKNDKNESNSSSSNSGSTTKAPAAGTTAPAKPEADARPLFPERQVSSTPSVANSSEPEPEHEDDHAPHASSTAANEELANSPTKRMRTLSISVHTEVTSPKRSRVGSFTLVTAHP